MFLPAKILTEELIDQIVTRAHLRVAFGCSRVIGIASLVCLTAVATGCKTGSSMNSSWLGLGMAGPDPATLAEAPPFEGDTTKPSATAKPYPTTSTPESYALQQGKLSEAAGQVASAAPQAPVTYGSTPPAADQVAATPAAMASAAPAAQVGPYQQMPTTTQQPSAVPPAAMPAATTMAADGAIGYGQPQSRFSQAAPTTTSPPVDLSNQPSGRFSAIADQRVAESQPSAASATAAFGSRYSAPAPVESMPPVSSEAGQYQTAPSAGRYETTTASAFGVPAATSEPPAVNPAASSAPESAVAPEQPAGPIGEGLPAPPTSRRPDPGYRPGNTSSYRPAQPIYADAPLSVPATASASGGIPAEEQVKPVLFEAELGVPQQAQP